MRSLLTLLVLLAALPAQVRAEAQPAQRSIVQQRLPDGRVLFTDRPLDEARTLRSWQYQPEDPVLGAQRRAAAEREAAAVTERIARQLEQQREQDREIEVARLQAALAAAEREAERARSEAEPAQVIVWPRRAWRPHGPSFKPHPPGARPPFKPHPPGMQPPSFGPQPPRLRPPHGPGLRPGAGTAPSRRPSPHDRGWPH